MLRQSRQLNPIIYKIDDKYGIIISDKDKLNATYDSLFYIRQAYNSQDKTKFQYLAGIKNPKNNQWSFGVIDQFGDEVIPIIYDTLLTYLPKLGYTNQRGKTTLTINPPNSYGRNNPKDLVARNGWFQVIKNNKRGIISLHKKVLVPCEYDGIYINDVAFYTPLKTKQKYFIFKKDGMYGFSFKLNESTKNISDRILFPFYPTTLIPNYDGHQGVDLVCLTKDRGVFCYARDDGFMYYREK